MKIFSSIQDWLDYIIGFTSYTSFYPSAIHKRVNNITNDDIVTTCLKYIEENKLYLMYEVLCPNCFSTLGKYETLNQMPNTIDCCESCNEENIEAFENCIVFYKIIR